MLLKKLLVLSTLISCMTILTNNGYCVLTFENNTNKTVVSNNNTTVNANQNIKVGNKKVQSNKTNIKTNIKPISKQPVSQTTTLNSNSNQQKSKTEKKPASTTNNKPVVAQTNEKVKQSIKQEEQVNSLQSSIANINNHILTQLDTLKKVNDSLKSNSEEFVGKFSIVSKNISTLINKNNANISQLIQENQQLKNENLSLKSRFTRDLQVNKQNPINIQGRQQDNKIDIKALNENDIEINQAQLKTNLKSAPQMQTNNFPQIQNIEINKPTMEVSKPNYSINNPTVQQQYYTQPTIRSSRRVSQNNPYYQQMNTQYQQYNQMNQEYYSNQNMPQYNRKSINSNQNQQAQYSQPQYNNNQNQQAQYNQTQYTNDPNAQVQYNQTTQYNNPNQQYYNNQTMTGQSYRSSNNIYIPPSQIYK